jgi:hypothetical protein
MEKIGLSLVGIGAGDIVDGTPITQQTQAFKNLHELLLMLLLLLLLSIRFCFDD